MAARRLTCVCPVQAGVLAVITTGSTVCGFGTLTAESVRACRASVYAAACPPSSTAISVNRAAAAGQLSEVGRVGVDQPGEHGFRGEVLAQLDLGGTAEQRGQRGLVGTGRRRGSGRYEERRGHPERGYPERGYPERGQCVPASDHDDLPDGLSLCVCCC